MGEQECLLGECPETNLALHLFLHFLPLVLRSSLDKVSLIYNRIRMNVGFHSFDMFIYISQFGELMFKYSACVYVMSCDGGWYCWHDIIFYRALTVLVQLSYRKTFVRWRRRDDDWRKVHYLLLTAYFVCQFLRDQRWHLATCVCGAARKSALATTAAICWDHLRAMTRRHWKQGLEEHTKDGH